ncbi:MAG: ABC transporter [Alkaliphilus sp.]|nr:ABC transporter ATP-binding protein [bacterium AH-315-L21]MBN4062749.1 ABC transporter ATP-binding protein [Alkaliphilus sp. AH-315-G20]PHS36542.1 MAG: ABC transporter [Alkaliphilus sp.]
MNIKLKSLVKEYEMSVSVYNGFVKKRIKEMQAVLQIDEFTFEANKIYGLIGPNGAGKTTLLKIIAGLTKSSYGEVTYGGAELNDERQREITYASQRPYLLKDTVYNNIAYPLKLRKENKLRIKSKVGRIMAEFDIYYLRNQQAKNLSGGEAQKVALARALVFEPELLLLDEPTANIDPNFVELIENAILERSNKKEITVIIATHNVGQARRLCDEVIFIKAGKIVESGKAKEMILKPKEEETKKFLAFEYDIG